MSLAEQLRVLRAERKVSLQTVADAVGATKPHVWELEKGKTKNPSLELLKQFSRFYGVTIEHLAGDESPNNGEMQYNALLRKLDPENMSKSDWKVVEQAIEFAAQVIADNKRK